MMYGLYGDFIGHTIVGGFFMIIFWVAVISFIVWVINLASNSHDEHKPKTAIDILKERYARGDISKEEFEDKKKDIIS